MVEIVDNRNCTFLSGMPVAGSVVPVAVVYGRESFGVLWQKDALESHWQNLVAVGFVDSARQPTQVHPTIQMEVLLGLQELKHLMVGFWPLWLYT